MAAGGEYDSATGCCIRPVSVYGSLLKMNDTFLTQIWASFPFCRHPLELVRIMTEYVSSVRQDNVVRVLASTAKTAAILLSRIAKRKNYDLSILPD